MLDGRQPPGHCSVLRQYVIRFSTLCDMVYTTFNISECRRQKSSQKSRRVLFFSMIHWGVSIWIEILPSTWKSSLELTLPGISIRILFHFVSPGYFFQTIPHWNNNLSHIETATNRNLVRLPLFFANKTCCKAFLCWMILYIHCSWQQQSLVWTLRCAAAATLSHYFVSLWLDYPDRDGRWQPSISTLVTARWNMDSTWRRRPNG